MFHTLPLLHELERRARALGFTWASLAAEVGIDRTTLAHIRSGRGRLSLGTLHRIAAWFPTDAAIQRCVWEYLLHDVETQKERDERKALRAGSAGALLDGLPDATREQLQALVTDFATRALRGESLLLTGTDPATLSRALAFLEAECPARGIHVLRRAANAVPPRSSLPALAAAPLLLVDRIEFASMVMTDVLQTRALYGKVTVATITADGTRSSLARAFRHSVAVGTSHDANTPRTDRTS